MPSKTPKMRRTMAAAAHGPKFAAKMDIPMKVAKKFNKADQKKRKAHAGYMRDYRSKVKFFSGN